MNIVMEFLKVLLNSGLLILINIDFTVYGQIQNVTYCITPAKDQKSIIPLHYDIKLNVHDGMDTFTGTAEITLKVLEKTQSVILEIDQLVIEACIIKKYNISKFIHPPDIAVLQNISTVQIFHYNFVPGYIYIMIIKYQGYINSSLEDFMEMNKVGIERVHQQ